ncbi:hypothetical protein ACFL6K_01240 [Candidatus Latescibacterota bacterium]
MTTEKRISKLEQEISRTKRMNRLMALMLIGVFLLGRLFAPGTPTAQENGVFHEIQAKAFVLKDENGLNRAILTMLGDGPTLEMYDENGTVRAELSMIENAPYFGLFDKNFKSLWSAP